MKKLNKIFLSLGIVSTTITPLFFTASCSNSEEKEKIDKLTFKVIDDQLTYLLSLEQNPTKIVPLNNSASVAMGYYFTHQFKTPFGVLHTTTASIGFNNPDNESINYFNGVYVIIAALSADDVAKSINIELLQISSVHYRLTNKGQHPLLFVPHQFKANFK